jgi:outer membrane protein assembly factor BamB
MRFFSIILLLSLGAARLGLAADQPQWGEPFSRNMVSDELQLPVRFDPGRRDTKTGAIKAGSTEGVRWVARLGDQTNGSPVVAGGKILVGTNNGHPRDERIENDRGVLACFDEATGEFLWQLNVPKRYEIKYGDWHYVGFSSPPTVVGDRAYAVTNRGEVVCLDMNGLADGNDGPFLDEARHRTDSEATEFLEPTDKDADIVWLRDMVELDGVIFHNATNCSILVDSDVLYLCTSNGVEWTHSRVANPEAPTVLALDRRTGKRLARDDFDLGLNIIHGQWSSVSSGKVDGRKLLFLGTGNGHVYGFKPYDRSNPSPRLKTVWDFNGQPAAQSEDDPPLEFGFETKSYEVTGMPVFYKNRVYVAITQDPWHTGKTGWFVCLDATAKGDITRTGLVWSYSDIGRSISTASIADGLVYIADFEGKLHCLDAETGRPYWVHDAGGPIWGSTLVADGKVYMGTGRRTLWVLKAGKKLSVLSKIRFSDKINTTPVAANGTLYLATTKHLYAIGPEQPKREESK